MGSHKTWQLCQINWAEQARELLIVTDISCQTQAANMCHQRETLTPQLLGTKLEWGGTITRKPGGSSVLFCLSCVFILLAYVRN